MGKDDKGDVFYLYAPRRAHEFIVDDKSLFEVGGKGKTFKQIKDIPDSFLALDNIEHGMNARIPLWLFGFLY